MNILLGINNRVCSGIPLDDGTQPRGTTWGFGEGWQAILIWAMFGAIFGAIFIFKSFRAIFIWTIFGAILGQCGFWAILMASCDNVQAILIAATYKQYLFGECWDNI